MALMMPAVADDDDSTLSPQKPVAVDSGIVKEILRSDMIMLDDDKRFRLENILIPPFEETPVLEELNRALLNRAVTVYMYQDADKRGSIPLVHVVTDNNVWIQEDLVSKGLAWAFSSETSQQMMDTLKIVEDNARTQQVGFWKDPAYAIKTPTTVKKFMNTYQIVEGKILSVNADRSDVAYFNFGKNWKTDFVIRIRGDREFLNDVKDPEHPEKAKRNAWQNFNETKWKNRIVRVRGWVHGTNGPVIDVTDKEQIDFIEPDIDTMETDDK